MGLSSFLGSFAVISLVVSAALMRPKRTYSSKSHPAEVLTDIWSKEDLAKLMEHVKANGENGKFYKLATSDSTPLNEHIGEAVPYTEGEACPHLFLRPNRNRTLCHMTGRLDVGRHYVLTGGFSGLRESHTSLVNRAQSYAKFFIKATREGEQGLAEEDLPIDQDPYPALFQSKGYRKAVDRVCPGKGYLESFQLGIIIQLPGQQVPMHADAPWFIGADRFSLPVWFLVVMSRSGLFKDREISQLQGVAYVHNWGSSIADLSDKELENVYGGGFYHHSPGESKPAEIFAPRPNSAILLDGSQCVHGTTLFHPPGSNWQRPPAMETHVPGSLTYNRKRDKWIVSNGTTTLAEYNSSELRMALVWRSKCHESKEAMEEYHNKTTKTLAVDEVLKVLQEDLVKRGRLKADSNISRFDLAIMLLDEYVAYPTSRLVPNYCALAMTLPTWAQPIAGKALSLLGCRGF